MTAAVSFIRLWVDFYYYFWAIPLGESCDNLGLKRVVRVPNCGSVRQLKRLLHHRYVTGQKWSVSKTVRYRLFSENICYFLKHIVWFMSFKTCSCRHKNIESVPEIKFLCTIFVTWFCAMVIVSFVLSTTVLKNACLNNLECDNWMHPTIIEQNTNNCYVTAILIFHGIHMLVSNVRLCKVI